MYNTFIVSLVKKIYNTDNKYAFFRMCEFVSLLVIVLIVAVIGVVYSAISGSGNLMLCVWVIVGSGVIFGVIAFHGQLEKKKKEAKGSEKK